MTSFYESATSGLNFDRFTDEILNESTVTKMKQHFWTAKQLLRTKLGKKEDEFLEASDADFDTKLSLYFSVRDTSRSLLACMEDYHHWMSELVETEKDLGDFLSIESRREKEHLARVMQAVGKTQRLCSRQRAVAVRPLIRLYHDIDIFNERAIGDCASTVDAAEKARLEYRGSLLWMKKTSAELNPENTAQLDDYRTAQNVVRLNKEKLDKLKDDTLQKVDLLNTSRRTLLLSLTKEYAQAMQKFFDDSVKAYDAVLDELKDIDSYEIDILKILNDPVGTAVEQQKERNEAKRRRRIKAQEKPPPAREEDALKEGR
ncbi:Arfaptin-like domain containing protein [Aphelenchoides avenae]|nr:Arfaptin-like domain containing protein [Aphelenchus avenae]